MTAGGGTPHVKLAVDIGGTFTDVVLEIGAAQTSTKVLTETRAPERGVMAGIRAVLSEAGMAASRVDMLVHGTTLATNALIERKGARTALLATQGHRDTLDLAYEDRFAEYDVYIDKPEPLVPRNLRFTVAERITARGDVLLPLHEEGVRQLVPQLRAAGIESLAIGFLHAYANGAHERRAAEILAAEMPGLWITLSSEVCPEIREYDRFSTAAANAYVQPLMAGYLERLATALAADGFDAGLYLMLSGGGLATLDTAKRFPVRLVESGPAGGAILAASVARECAIDRLLSFDMGGTTAKICLIDDAAPQTSPSFEVARVYHYMKGSGLPLRVPVIELVEIGAGGGSIASIDSLGRIAVGPQSAGSDPGPSCYGRGGTAATVTDADLVLGKIDAQGFAGGSIRLDGAAARAAVVRAVGAALEPGGAQDGQDLAQKAALGVAEIVDENMASAARIHSIERGKTLGDRAMVAFGGAAPLHAARIAEKLGIDRVIVPTNAGVGSAVGFLRAPVAYEVVRSRYMRLSGFDAETANATLAEMSGEARDVVEKGAMGRPLVETRLAAMRYIGQGHEIAVPVPDGQLAAGDREALRDGFEAQYARQYGRAVTGVDVEIMGWSLTVSTAAGEAPAPAQAAAEGAAPPPAGRRQVYDAVSKRFETYREYPRAALRPGMRLEGPAVITEDQTTTIVTPPFDVAVNELGYIVMERRRPAPGGRR